MDTVTYPATKVRDELARWVFSKVDITEQKEMAAAFQVKAVPIAIAVSGDGRMLKRIPNFVEPDPFEAALREARAAR